MKIPTKYRTLFVFLGCMLLAAGCTTHHPNSAEIPLRGGAAIQSAIIDPEMDAVVYFTLENTTQDSVCVPEPALADKQTALVIATLKDRHGKMVEKDHGGYIPEESQKVLALPSGSSEENHLQFGDWKGRLSDYERPLFIQLRIPAATCNENIETLWPPEFMIESNWNEVDETTTDLR